MMLIVPDWLYDELHRRIDALKKDFPDLEKDRDRLYRQLLEYVWEHGHIPNFTLDRIQ